MNGPAPSFVLWNPQLVAEHPPTVELYMTLGEGRFGAGAEAFFAELLRDAHVEVSAITGWSSSVFRAFYFTSYPWPNEAWEDRWPFAWLLQIQVSAPPVFRGDDDNGKYASAAFDPTAKWNAPPPTDARCLVVADFESRESAETARELLGKGGSLRGAMKSFWQLAIDLGPRDDAFYANGADEAVSVMKQCQDLGGTIHYWDTIERTLKK